MCRRHEASQAQTAPAPVSLDAPELVGEHGGGHVGVPDGEQPAEPAALGRVRERTELEAAHGPKEATPAGRRAGAIGASDRSGDTSASPRTPTRRRRRRDGPRGTATAPRCDPPRPRDRRRRRRRGRGRGRRTTPDGATTASNPAKTSTNRSTERPSDIRVAGVEVELAAAGLAPGKDDLQPEPLENARRSRGRRTVAACPPGR